MQSIVNYFNTFTNVIFGLNLIVTPRQLFDWYASTFTTWQGSSYSFDWFIARFIYYPNYLFSTFVWVWFAILTVNLLLIFPYHWIRSVIRKCRLS